jgi:hypothetical protein
MGYPADISHYPIASQLPLLAAGHGKLKFLYLGFAVLLRTTPSIYAFIGTLKVVTHDLRWDKLAKEAQMTDHFKHLLNRQLAQFQLVQKSTRFSAYFKMWRAHGLM